MSAVVAPSRVRITVDQFHRMGEVGILPPENRIELLDGEMINMAPIGSRHADTVNRLAAAFLRIVADAAVVSIQNPVQLSSLDEPQPDLTVLRQKPEGYRDALPTAADVLLLVEVSDTTLQYDREEKLPLYAKHGVAEVWIMDVAGKRLEVYRDPVSAQYRLKLERTARDTISPLAYPAIQLDLSELLA
jgi:Uma2 family endonuclease